MSLCGTCKHWGDGTDTEQKFRTCQAVVHASSRDIDNDGVDYILEYGDGPQSNYEIAAVKEWNAARDKKAHACDQSDYCGSLRCREDFGCVLHEPKKEDANA